MSATVILNPASAAAIVCHEEQLRIWAHDNIISHLAMEGYLRDDLSHDDMIHIEHIVMQEIKSIVEIAIDHPEAVTIRRRR
jgi:Fe2+ or Zn2+ uptake regulation protein